MQIIKKKQPHLVWLKKANKILNIIIEISLDSARYQKPSDTQGNLQRTMNNKREIPADHTKTESVSNTQISGKKKKKNEDDSTYKRTINWIQALSSQDSKYIISKALKLLTCE